MSTITVRIGDETRVLGPADELTFGRSADCAACLDPDDLAISRLAGSVSYERDTWWVQNRSSSRQLVVVDDIGFRSVLPPGRRTAVEAPTRVVVDGTRASHTLTLTPQAAPAATDADVPAGAPTAIGGEVLMTDRDRLALVALFSGYLDEPPRYDPHPKKYAAAAARLGWKQTTLMKRVEYLRTRLDAAGVPNMMGFNALANLAEYVLSRGLITRDDLTLLRR